MKKMLLISLICSPLSGIGQGAMGEVIGTVVLKKDQSAIYNARVYTESNGSVYQAKTDPDGRFRISAIPAGKYFFSIIYQGDTLSNILAHVPMDGIENMGLLEFTLQTITYQTMHAGPPIIPLLRYGVASEVKMDLDQIKRSPQRFDQKSMIASMSSDIKLMDDGSLVFRGARKNDMIYMMDGVKMREISNVPSASIGGMMVYTGGIPAKYGDTTGGVVVMESLSYFDLYRNWISMQLRKE